MRMEKYTPNHAHFFVHKKYTTFNTERIVALPQSVNNIFSESSDFSAIDGNKAQGRCEWLKGDAYSS
jgi:hypothetical protein